MRKLFMVMLAVVAACGGNRGSVPRGAVVGAVGARQSVEGFLSTVRSKDIQAMSLIWGTAKGPAREQIDRNELEKRELLLVCYLQHDSFRVVEETSGEGGRSVFKVELQQGSLKRATIFKSIKGPDERWFMEDVDISGMQDFCKGR